MSVLVADNKTLSLTARKDIRDNLAKKEENIKEIEAATGQTGWTFDFEGDAAAFNNAVGSGYKDRLGEILFGSYLKEIATMLTRELKDDMVKEAFLEAATSKKILFIPHAEKPSGGEYNKVEIKDGALVVGCHPEYFWTNISDVGYFKLEKLL